MNHLRVDAIPRSTPSAAVDSVAKTLSENVHSSAQTFSQIGILHHPMKPESVRLAGEIADFLDRAGVQEIWRASAWGPEAVLDRLHTADLLITLGGDGTLLRAARMGAPYEAPMLGVKMGKLGFLAEILPENWQAPLRQVLQGDYWLEERLMVRACVQRPMETSGELCLVCEYDALNDVVVSRGDLARVVRISAHLDGEYLTTYSCDGVIVSTATGSTGYALAVGGPILPPELRNILVIPIAPHLSMDRAVVLSEGSEVRLQAFADYHPMLTVDGQVVVELKDADQVVITSSPHVARFIRLHDRNYFYQHLMEKLRWTDGNR